MHLVVSRGLRDPLRSCEGVFQAFWAGKSLLMKAQMEH